MASTAPLDGYKANINLLNEQDLSVLFHIHIQIKLRPIESLITSLN